MFYLNDDISGTGNDIEIKQKAHFKQKSFFIYNRGKFLEGIYKSLGYQDFKVLFNFNKYFVYFFDSLLNYP